VTASGEPITVSPVVGRRDLETFIRLPYRLLQDEPCWPPPLLFDVRNRLDRSKNPFFEHGEAEYFVARRGREVVGRIAAIRNHLHEEVHGEKLGFFGWFDLIDDEDVARALLDTARDWVAERGLEAIRGPVSFSLNDECGCLVDGFEHPATIMTPWNPPWYGTRIEAAGFRKSKDLYSFALPVMDFGAERIGRIVKRIKKREGARLREFDPKHFDQEVARIESIYNEAWTDNWGFVPMTPAEFRHMAKELKPVLVPELAHFVEIEGRPVGFSLVLPDVNVILKKLKGRLFPLGILRLLFGLKRVERIRLIAMGVVRNLHMKGLDSVLYLAAFEGARKLGKTFSELGWVLEDNAVMINTIERIGGRRYRTHRLYDAPAVRHGNSEGAH